MIKKIKKVLRRLTGISTPWFGASWVPPEPNPLDRMLREYLDKCHTPDIAFRVPLLLLIQVGAATLSENSTLIELCRLIELHGESDPFAVWVKHGLSDVNRLSFLKWQRLHKQGLHAVISDPDRWKIVALFHSQQQTGSHVAHE